MSEVVSDRCEQTIRSIAFTVANYEEHEDAAARRGHRRGRLRRRADEDALRASQASRQAAIFRIVSLVEAHTANEIVGRLAGHFPEPRSSVQAESYIVSEDSATRTWAEMKDRLSRWFGLDFSKCSEWQQMLLLTEIRNAIAHGTGELTRRQQRDKKLASWPSQLRKLDIELVIPGVVLGDDAVQLTRKVCVRFLVWLDHGLAAYDESAA